MRFKFKLLVVVKMLKKKLGIEAIEKDSWTLGVLSYSRIGLYFKIPPTLVIPDGCKWIGDWAFWRCKKLRKVVIPESVVEIRDFAFKECEKLKRVVADGLLILKDYAFWGCRGLADLIIPVNVKSEDYAFSGCEKAEIKYRVKYKC